MGIAAASAKADGRAKLPPRTPIVDTHIHLFDIARPGGVPWPTKDDVIYEPSLPSRYERLTQSLGVVGAIVVEASPLESDNDWVLQQAAAHPTIVGMLDRIWDVFGEDHLIFGSDWPNSDHVAPYAETLSLVQSSLLTKGPIALEKHFWKNSIAAYGWQPRQPDQPKA